MRTAGGSANGVNPFSGRGRDFLGGIRHIATVYFASGSVAPAAHAGSVYVIGIAASGAVERCLEGLEAVA